MICALERLMPISPPKSIVSLYAGLRALGNTTEINLYGGVVLKDANASAHQDVNDLSSLNTINHIKPLGNYQVDAAKRYTFCTKRGNSWLYNANACYGNTVAFTLDKLMGMRSAYNTPYMGSTAISDTDLIPNVYVYGSDPAIDTTSYSDPDYSRIKTIKQMYITTPSTNPTLHVDPLTDSNKITLQTGILWQKYEDSQLLIKDSITFGTVELPLGGVGSAFYYCKKADGTFTEMIWKERKTSNQKKVKVLACKK